MSDQLFDGKEDTNTPTAAATPDDHEDVSAPDLNKLELAQKCIIGTAFTVLFLLALLASIETALIYGIGMIFGVIVAQLFP